MTGIFSLPWLPFNCVSRTMPLCPPLLHYIRDGGGFQLASDVDVRDVSTYNNDTCDTCKRKGVKGGAKTSRVVTSLSDDNIAWKGFEPSTESGYGHSPQPPAKQQLRNKIIDGGRSSRLVKGQQACICGSFLVFLARAEVPSFQPLDAGRDVCPINHACAPTGIFAGWTGFGGSDGLGTEYTCRSRSRTLGVLAMP